MYPIVCTATSYTLTGVRLHSRYSESPVQEYIRAEYLPGAVCFVRHCTNRVGVITVEKEGDHNLTNNRLASSEVLVRARFTLQPSLMFPVCAHLHLVGLCRHTKYSIPSFASDLLAALSSVYYVWCHVDLNGGECGTSGSSAIAKDNNSSKYYMRCIRYYL